MKETDIKILSGFRDMPFFSTSLVCEWGGKHENVKISLINEDNV